MKKSSERLLQPDEYRVGCEIVPSKDVRSYIHELILTNMDAKNMNLINMTPVGIGGYVMRSQPLSEELQTTKDC